MKMEKYGRSEKPTMLFLHGYGAHPKLYREFIEAAAHDYHVHVPELFGLSGHCRRDFEQNLTVIREMMRPHELDDSLVVGHSYGALAAMHLAVEFPDIKRAVAINPLLPQLFHAGKFRLQLANLQRDLRYATGETRGMLANLEVGLRYGMNVLANPLGYVEGALKAIATPLPSTKSVVPIDMIYADLDSLFHIEDADLGRWREVLPNLRLFQIADYSHNWIIYHGRFAYEKMRELK
jgi:pimeloyl-ACP methyl ester carboxylesterase